jgi:hypothetical protein
MSIIVINQDFVSVNVSGLLEDLDQLVAMHGALGGQRRDHELQIE